MTRKIALFFFFLSPLLMGLNHPFYLAVIEAEYSSKSKELGVSIKVYPDDMEAALKKAFNKTVTFSDNNKDQNNKFIEGYIKSHLGIKINGTQAPYNYMGYEYSNDAILIYFSITPLKNVKSIEINTDMMYDYKDEQTNIIHIIIDGKRNSFKLNVPNKSAIAYKQ
jgi:alpha-galactosidase/6-phospho-beta-glucosidase family protein